MWTLAVSSCPSTTATAPSWWLKVKLGGRRGERDKERNPYGDESSKKKKILGAGQAESLASPTTQVAIFGLQCHGEKGKGKRKGEREGDENKKHLLVGVPCCRDLPLAPGSISAVNSCSPKCLTLMVPLCPAKCFLSDFETSFPFLFNIYNLNHCLNTERHFCLAGKGII